MRAPLSNALKPGQRPHSNLARGRSSCLRRLAGPPHPWSASLSSFLLGLPLCPSLGSCLLGLRLFLRLVLRLFLRLFLRIFLRLVLRLFLRL